MVVEPIPVMRAAYLNLFRAVSDQSDRHDTACLRKFNLPASLERKPGTYVPLNATLLFAQCVAHAVGMENFLLQLSPRLQVPIFGAELRGAVMRSPSLGAALENFTRLVDHEQSNVHCRISRRGDEVQISSSVARAALSDADFIGEWLRVMSVVAVVRHFAGECWMPLEITLQSHREPGPRVRRACSRTRVTTGQAETAIAFPASLPGLSTDRICHLDARADLPGIQSAASSPATWSFPIALREIIQAHLDEGYPDISLAASIFGCSVRTLQRRLKEFDLSYTDVVQQARFNVATHLLRDPGTKVIDAAFAVGYEDPSHFTRAFRQVAGVTPNQYRRLNYAH